MGLDTLKYNDVNYGSRGQIHRLSLALYDTTIPAIPSYVKIHINDIFDGYYGGYTPNKTGFFHPEVYLLNPYECLELVDERAASDDEDENISGGAVRKKDLNHYHGNLRTLLTKLRKKKLSRTKRKRKKHSKKKSKARKKKYTKRYSYF